MRLPSRRTRATEIGSIGSPAFARRLLAVLASTAIVALVAAGCGSSSKPTITKADFVTKSNAICSKGNQDLSTAEASLGEHSSQAQLTAFVTDTFVPNVQTQIDAVRALGAPAGEEDTVTHMLDVAQEDLNTVKSNPTVLAQSNAKPFADFAAIAHPYGLTECASKE